MTTVDEDGETFRYIEAGEPDAECCSRDGFRRGDLVAVRIPKPPKWPPLCRWAAIKPGQPWRLV